MIDLEDDVAKSIREQISDDREVAVSYTLNEITRTIEVRAYEPIEKDSLNKAEARDSFFAEVLKAEARAPKNGKRKQKKADKGPVHRKVATYLGKKKYKTVAEKIRPVFAELPDEFRIVREIKGNPLEGMPEISAQPRDFVPTGRYTQERKDEMDKVHREGFLWPEECKLVHNVIMDQNEAFAWEDSERGHFREDFFPPIKIPTVPHTPWVQKNIPIPNGLYDEVCKIIKSKQASGVYELSNASYRSRWFTVVKKDGKSLRIVHSLEPLNAVTIAHSGLPPATEQLAAHFAGRACGGMFDLYVGYDERIIDERFRDMTTFQTPFGAMRLVTLPMGWTNSVPIFHDDVTFILKDETPEYTWPYIDDVGVRGPKTRYEKMDGTYETIPENPGIRRFVWEHLHNVNRILQRMKYAGGTFSGYKSVLCADEITVVGHLCTYEGRRPTTDRVKVITNWGDCVDITDVRSFLGTAGILRSYIPGYTEKAHPLQQLTRKNMVFKWGPEQKKSMELLKQGARDAKSLKPLDYENGGDIVLAVDTSYMAVGFYIYQEDKVEPAKKTYARFGSIKLKDHEARYSQPKRELFGLKKALEDNRMLLIGCRKLVVETDAKYIDGMLRNPDMMPNATINRWIEEILLFHFTLRHKAGKTFGPDGLSRRKHYPGDEEPRVPSENEETWILPPTEVFDETKALPIEVSEFNRQIDTRGGYTQSIPVCPQLALIQTFVHRIVERSGTMEDAAMSLDEFQQELAKADDLREAEKSLWDSWGDTHLPTCADIDQANLKQFVSVLVLPEESTIGPYQEEHRSLTGKRQDKQLSAVVTWLKNKSRYPEALNDEEKQKFERFTRRFFLFEGRLYLRSYNATHRLVVEKDRRMYMMTAAHDHTGHRGFYATSQLLTRRFWWPEMERDINHYVKTCHRCQERQTTMMKIRPTMTHTPSLFQTLHADSMLMSPPSNQCSYIAHGRDHLSVWVEGRALRKETGRTLGQWLWEDIICRWAGLLEIVTDNGPAYRLALKWLSEKYGIVNIKISPYNSKANRKVERMHWDIRQMLYKTLGERNISKWFWILHYVFWADRVTIRRRLGCSPYFMVTAAHPTLPLDVKEATWLVHPPDRILSHEELIALRAQALAKHRVHVREMRSRMDREKYERLLKYEKDHQAVIKDYSFAPGDLVLVRNTAVEASLDRKLKARYLGPMIVVRRTRGGSYIVAEMTGAVWQFKVGAFRVVPYYARERISLPAPIEELVDVSADTLKKIEDGPDDIFDDPLLDKVTLVEEAEGVDE